MPHRESAVVSLSPSCRLLGLTVDAQKLMGYLKHKGGNPTRSPQHLRKTRDEPLEKLVFSPVYILTGSQADMTQGTGTVLGPEITWRHEQLIETVSARGRVWLELRV